MDKSSVCGLCNSNLSRFSCTCSDPPLVFCPLCISSHFASPSLHPHDIQPIPEGSKPPSANEFCSLCKEDVPEVVCGCVSAGVVLCGKCISSHSKKLSKTVHTLLPLAARPFMHDIGYVDRLKKRQIGKDQGLFELQANVDRVLECEKELDIRIDNAVKKLRSYQVDVRTQLEKLRETLVQTIADARKEVETHLYEDGYRPDNGLAAELLDYHRGTLTLFQYQFDNEYRVTIKMKHKSKSAQVPKVTGCVPNIIKGEIPTAPIIKVTNQTVARYDYIWKTFKSEVVLDPRLEKGSLYSSLTVMKDGRVFLCGQENPVSTCAYIIDPQTGRTRCMSPMISARYGHAVLQYKNCIYVFGGSGPDGRLQSCEKFVLATDNWLPLSKMLTPRDCFNPCAHKRFVYIFGGRETALCELYDIGGDCFSQLQFTLPVAGQTVAAFQSEQDVVIVQSGFVSKLMIEKPKSLKTTNSQVTGPCWGNMSPVVCGRTVFIPQFYQKRVLEVPINSEKKRT